MSLVSTKKLLFFLADEQNRTYYVEGGVVKKNSIPSRIKHNPDGWKDMTFQFATNQKYFSTLRQFTTAIKFVEDGQAIIADRMFNGLGTEEILYLIVLRQDPTMGLNGYKLEYKSRLDFSKFNGDPRTGISMNTLQDDVFAIVQANENAVYSLPCNSSNPSAIQVLFDGTLLQDKLNYKTTDIVIRSTDNDWYALPFVFLNNEGDSVGAIFGSQNYDQFPDPAAYIHYSTNNNNFLSFNRATKVHLKGNIKVDIEFTGAPSLVGIFVIEFATDLGTFPPPANQIIFLTTAFLTQGVHTFPVDVTINLAPNEKLFLLSAVKGVVGGNNFTAHFLESSISVLFASEPDPSLAYALRGIDVLKQMVSKITNGKFTANSKFLSNNNKKVFLSGSSLRSFPDAVIQLTFSDFFQCLKSCYNLGLTVRNGVLWLEPVEDIYNSNNELFDVGDISEVTLTIAQEYIFTSAKVGYIKQTYNKRNGRYEYNCTHNYKFPIYTILNQLDLVSPIRADSFGMEFIRTGYPDLNTTDDKGDADVFSVMITDSVGQATGVISNAIAFTIETLTIASPILKTPFSNSTVYFANPTITGVCQPNMTVTVFVDGTIDGTTISDADGNWSYEVQRSLQPVSLTFNGVHRFEATAQTDPSNISQFSNVLTLTIDTANQSAFLITSPTNNDTLYNNLPIISGISPSGAPVKIFIDSVPFAIATANTSGIWSFQTVTPLSDGIHLIRISSPGLTAPMTIAIGVNKNVATPLITNIVYNQVVYTNLPKIIGVGIPGTVVPIYLDGGGGPVVGGIAGPLGTAVIDANGDWSFQVTGYIDPSTLISEPNLPEGLHVIATTATPTDVLATISGYRLMRGSNKGPVMDYDTIRLDDQYIPPGLDPSTLPPTLGTFLHPETLYNIEETTPLRQLRAHDNILKPFLQQQPDQQIQFNGAEINANLVTQKNGVVFNEGANVNVSDLSAGLYRPFFLNFKTRVPATFNDIMTSINNDGYITTHFKNMPIYVLPIGTMSMKPATDEAQAWKLLVSGKTPFSSLLQIFGNGLPINIGPNMIRISDKNPLHFVKYNYTPPAGYHFSDIYDDWEANRYAKWPAYQADYYQPVQKGTDKIALQFITNGVGSLQIQMWSRTSGLLIDTFPAAPVATPIAPPPVVVQEVSMDLSSYPEDQYWFALYADGAIVGISEKIWLKSDWPDTFLFEYDGSSDLIDYFFSTGIKPMIRLQAKFLPWDVDSEVDNYEDENGDFQITRGVPLIKRILQLGNEYSLISDWMNIIMNQITLLDNFRIEGQHYTRNNNTKVEKQDFGTGIPELMVKMEIILADNQTGADFTTPGDTGINSVTFSYDAPAFGMQPGVINVTEN